MKIHIGVGDFDLRNGSVDNHPSSSYLFANLAPTSFAQTPGGAIAQGRVLRSVLLAAAVKQVRRSGYQSRLPPDVLAGMDLGMSRQLVEGAH